MTREQLLTAQELLAESGASVVIVEGTNVSGAIAIRMRDSAGEDSVHMISRHGARVEL